MAPSSAICALFCGNGGLAETITRIVLVGVSLFRRFYRWSRRCMGDRDGEEGPAELRGSRWGVLVLSTLAFADGVLAPRPDVMHLAFAAA